MKKMKQKVLSVLLAVAMVIGLLPVLTPETQAASYAAVVCDNNGNVLIWYKSHQAAWAEAVRSGHTLKLLSNWYANDKGEMDEGAKGDDKDYFSNDTLYVPKGKSVTIDLNGHCISRRLNDPESDGEVIYLSQDASLTIKDTTTYSIGAIRGGYSSNGAGGIHAKAGSRIYLYSGSISDCRSTEEGGAVYLASGAKMYMYGGNIYRCSAGKGGAVYADKDSQFIMSGGSIANNTSWDEDSTEVEQENAVVYLNKATGIFSGGQISRNTGNGIFSDQSVLRLSGSVDISNNSGYGVVLPEESTQVTMTGGTITKNKMGGVLVGIRSNIKMGGSIQIYNNRDGMRNMYLLVYVDVSDGGWWYTEHEIVCSKISILDGGFEPSAKIGLSASDSRFIHTSHGPGGDREGIFCYADEAWQYSRYFFGDAPSDPLHHTGYSVAGGYDYLRLCGINGYAHDPKITGVASIVDRDGADITEHCAVSIDRNAFTVNIRVPENVDVSWLTITYELDDFTKAYYNDGELTNVDIAKKQHTDSADYRNQRVLTYFCAGGSSPYSNNCWQNWTVTVTKTQGVNIYNVTVDGGTGGGAFRVGQSVTVQAEEKAGMRFLAWRAEGVELTEEQRAASPMTFTMPNSNVTLTALYEPVQSQVDLTITAPVGGQALDDAATVTTPNGEAELPIQWTPTAPAAGFGTEYTAVVTISTGSYSFSQDVAATVNGAAARVTRVDDYTIAVSYTFQTARARLLSISPVTLSGVANGTSLAAIVAQLGDSVGIQTEDASTTTAKVTWDTDNVRYTQEAQFEQIVFVKGTVTLPDHVEANGVDLTIFAHVTVAGLERVSYARMQGATDYETYTESRTVEFKSDTQGATIYYTLTTDGSKPATPVPGAAGTEKYTGPVTLSGEPGKTVNYRFKTIAVKDGMTDSATQYYTVIISRPEPTYTVSVTDGAQVCGLGSGTYHKGDLVTVKIADVDPDRLFTGWTATGIALTEAQKKAGTFTFTMPAGNVTITASFRNKVKSVELTDPLAVTEGSALPAAGALSATAKDKNGEPLTNAVTAQLYAWTPGDATAGYGRTYTAFILLHPANGLNLIADEVQVTLNGKTYTAGRVEGSNDFLLSVSFDTAQDTLESIAWPGNMTLYVGDTLTLPDRVSVTTTHNTLTSAELNWEGAGSVDTAAAGAYTLTASVYLPDTVNTTGVALSKTVTVTVKADDPVAPVTVQSVTDNAASHSKTIKLACATPNAVITYTVDGGKSQTYTDAGIVLGAELAEGQEKTYTIRATANARTAEGHDMPASSAAFTYTVKYPLIRTVTVNGGVIVGTDPAASTVQIEAGQTVGIKWTEDSGKVFTGWTASSDVTFVNAAAETTAFTMPEGNVTITANTVDKIQSVTLCVTAPTVGFEFDPTGFYGTGDDAPAVQVAWTPRAGGVLPEQAAVNGEYTASIILLSNAGAGVVFADNLTATINGSTANVIKNPNGSFTITADFTAKNLTFESLAGLSDTDVLTVAKGTAWSTVADMLPGQLAVSTTEGLYRMVNVTWTETYFTTAGDGTITGTLKLAEAGISSTVDQRTVTIKTHVAETTVEMPTASVKSGLIETSAGVVTNITLTGPDNATIYYTTDGTAPTTESAPYTGPIKLTAGEPGTNTRYTIKAIAVNRDGYASPVATFTYVLSVPALKYTVAYDAGNCTVNGTTFEKGQTVNLVARGLTADNAFAGWTITKTDGGEDVTDVLLTAAEKTAVKTSFAMPEYAVTVTAAYVPKMTAMTMTVDAPVAGLPLDTTPNTLNVTFGSGTSQDFADKVTVTWMPGDTTAVTGTEYRGGVLLKPSAGYAFASGFSAKINGEDAQIVKNSDGSLMVYYTFAAAKARVTGLPTLSPVENVPTTVTTFDALNAAYLPRTVKADTTAGAMDVTVTWADNSYAGTANSSVTLTGTLTYPANVEENGKGNTVQITVNVGMAQVSTPRAVPLAESSGTDGYLGSVEVSLYCDTAGATIYYTLDGTEPKTSSTVYTGPFTLTGNSDGTAKTTTVKAIAVKSGMTSSAEMTAQAYKVTPVYTVTVDGISYGSFTKDKEITIYPQTSRGVHTGWTVVSGGASVSDNKFAMPASDVVITGVYKTAVRAVDLALDKPVQGGGALPAAADLTSRTTTVTVSNFAITPAGTEGKADFNTAYTITAKLNISNTSTHIFGSTVAVNIGGTPVTAAKNGESYDISYTVKTGKAKITGVTNPANLTGIANGTSMADILARLPGTVTVQTQAGEKTLTVVWDANPVSGSYDPVGRAAQSFTLRGVLRTDADLENPEGICANVNVSVSAAYSGGGSGGGTQVTVPVSTGDQSYQMPVTASGETVTMKTVDQSKLDAFFTAMSSVDTLSIDFTGVKKGVTSAQIPAQILTAVSKALEEKGTADAGMAILLPKGSAEFDADAAKSVAKQAGNQIQLNITDVKLSAAQKTALKDMTTYGGVSVTLTSNGKTISTFDGGTVLLQVPFTVPADQKAGGFSIWYVPENGAPEKLSTTYRNGCLETRVSHFSAYVIAYEEADAAGYANCGKDASCPLSAYSDLTPTAWYHDGVHYCLDSGLMKGVGDGKFDPTGTTSRAMVVTMLWRMAGSQNAGNSSTFTDVAADTWYSDAAAWGAENGIINGYNGAFDPGGAITREQLAAMLYRYAKTQGKGFTGDWMMQLDYPDAGSVSDWAYEAMCWMTINGVINGKDGKIVPTGAASRAEAAAMLQRFCRAIEK